MFNGESKFSIDVEINLKAIFFFFYRMSHARTHALARPPAVLLVAIAVPPQRLSTVVPVNNLHVSRTLHVFRNERKSDFSATPCTVACSSPLQSQPSRTL